MALGVSKTLLLSQLTTSVTVDKENRRMDVEDPSSSQKLGTGLRQAFAWTQSWGVGLFCSHSARSSAAQKVFLFPSLGRLSVPSFFDFPENQLLNSRLES